MKAIVVSCLSVLTACSQMPLFENQQTLFSAQHNKEVAIKEIEAAIFSTEPMCEFSSNNHKRNLHYVGDTDKHFVECISSHALENNVTLLISSKGGDVSDAIVGALMIKKGNWDVSIQGLCFSSCANYVIPAARQLVIKQYALIGLHGAPTDFSRPDIETELRENVRILSNGNPIEEEKMFDQLLTSLTKVFTEHAKFAERLRVGNDWYNLSDIEQMRAIGNDNSVKKKNEFVIVDYSMLHNCLPGVEVQEFGRMEMGAELAYLEEVATKYQMKLRKPDKAKIYNCK